MISLRKVDKSNVWSIVGLAVKENQRSFVATNAESIIEAYIAVTNNGTALPFGIYEDELPVGFLMIGYDTDDAWENAPAVASGNYCIWRLMIDQKFQAKGYGRQAIIKALEYIRTFPCGKADLCWLSYEPENIAAAHLYSSLDFRENGEKDGDELVAVLRLT